MTLWAATGTLVHALSHTYDNNSVRALCGARFTPNNPPTDDEGRGHPGYRAVVSGMVCLTCQARVARTTITALHQRTEQRALWVDQDLVKLQIPHDCTTSECYTEKNQPGSDEDYTRWHLIALCTTCGDSDSDDPYGDMHVPWPCPTLLSIYQPA